MRTDARFDLSTIFRSVAATVPDREAIVWRDRRPHVMALDSVGSTESGVLLATIPSEDVAAPTDTATFTPQPGTAVVSADCSTVLKPGEGFHRSVDIRITR